MVNLSVIRGAALLALCGIAAPALAAARVPTPRLARPHNPRPAHLIRAHNPRPAHLIRAHNPRPANHPRVPAFAPPAPVAAPSQPPKLDKATVKLVRKMLQAQNKLALEGTLVTETSLGTFVQHAVMDGTRAQRFECLSPPANKGEVIIDDGRSRYHTTPTGKPTVQPSQMAMRRVHVPEVMQEVRQGTLTVQQVGQGTVAGHACIIVRVGPPYAANWYQYWIDPANGAQLRIEEYDPSNHRLSATYFTDVAYNPTIDPHLFAAPDGAPHKRPPHPRQRVPTPAEAGFSVLQPAFLPLGFHFQTSVVRQRGAGHLVRMVYGNGLDALSLFETPDTRSEGPKAGFVKNPRPGVVTLRRNGLVIVLVGSLDVPTLQSVITSLH